MARSLGQGRRAGFDASIARAGTGHQNMRDRVGALDGRVSIVTAIGHGTVVRGSIPLCRNGDASYAAVSELGHTPGPRVHREWQHRQLGPARPTRHRPQRDDPSGATR
jgi:hypothetical protein